jgi:hypothetical protein
MVDPSLGGTSKEIAMWKPGNNPSDGLESTHLKELFSSGNQDWLDQWQPISIDWIQQDAQWVDLSNRPAYQQQKTSRSKKTGKIFAACSICRGISELADD